MRSLKTNYPHPDRCVPCSNNLHRPSTCDQSKITYSKNRKFNHSPVRTVQIGLGIEPRKMNRGKESSFAVKPVAKRGFI